jgi:hypothetical protein
MKSKEQILEELKQQISGMTYITNGEIFEHTEEEKDALLIEWASSSFELQKTEYIEQRQLAYPSTNDQWDILYHQGFDAWKAVIKEVKDRYPKPTE